ncbi:TolC family protein [Lachnospiraceae bacterium NSJ-143]|nr:TolC family protein [Lachnospiraceae bacterium NSJ-143]
MKLRYISFITAAAVMLSPCTAHGYQAEGQTELSAETADLTESYSSLISNEYDESLETLTFEKAQEKALRNNTSLLNLSASMKLAEDELEVSYLEASADSGEDFSSLISFLNSKGSYENNEISKVAQEESVKHSMKESYINIIESQREIALAELSLKKDEMNLTLSKAKLSNGKISQSEFDSLELSYNNAKKQLENKKEELELDYVSLNILIGEKDLTKRYNFVMEAVYEPLELNMPVESYINGKTAAANSVKQAKKSYETTKQTSKLTPLNSSSINGYQSAQNSLNSAEMSYEDTKENVYKSLYQKYNSIIQNEKDYDSGTAELKLLRDEFERTQVKFLNGETSKYELITAEYSLAEKENTLLSGVYQHMLLKEELTNTDLM